jgi:predicted MFS family arabinose efflux permease
VDAFPARAHRQRAGLGRDFHRLWGAYSISEMGSALASGALPLIAVVALHVSTFQVSVLAAISALASAAIALPLGPFVEYRRKRPVMVWADLLGFTAIATIPISAALGLLTYVHLCTVGVVQTTCNIVFTAASGAHLKGLVRHEQRLSANSRFETTFWTATSTGPPLGGLLISWLGATSTLAVDAVSYLLSAIGIRSLRAAEPRPGTQSPDRRWLGDITSGWHYIFARPGLAALFWNSALFGGCITLSSPLTAVLMLRDLGLEPWQYRLALGLPGLGGIVGSVCTKPLTRRFGQRTVLLAFGVLRTLWLGFIAAAPTGAAGLAVIIAADFLLVSCAGVFNPTFVTYRMQATDDSHMTRVTAAWSITSKIVQPLFILAGGLVAAATNLASAAVLLLCSGLLLPWRSSSTAAQSESCAGGAVGPEAETGARDLLGSRQS